MTLEPDETPIPPVPVAQGYTDVAALSSRGRLLVFGLDEMREVPRGRGVIVMGLNDDERLLAVGLSDGRKVILHGANRAGRLVVAVLDANAPGGQAGASSKIENYFGFPTGISGLALAH